jgi:hypothetical protein
LCKQESINLWCRGKLLISIKRAMNSSQIELLWLVWDQSRSKYYLRTKIRISQCFSSAQEFQMGNFQKYWSQNVGQDFIVLGGRLMSSAQETQSMWEIRLLRGRLPCKGGGLTGMTLIEPHSSFHWTPWSNLNIVESGIKHHNSLSLSN